MGTGFITRECQAVVEQVHALLVKRGCLARLSIVEREQIKTDSLSHVHSRQHHVEIGNSVLLEVWATYPYHSHSLTLPISMCSLPGEFTHNVHVSAITRAVVRDSVVGDSQFPIGRALYTIFNTVLTVTA